MYVYGRERTVKPGEDSGILGTTLALSCILVVAGLFYFGRDALDAIRWHNKPIVIDGDTIELLTFERVRLVGFDTPEPGGRAQCQVEADLARHATQRLRQLIANAQRWSLEGLSRQKDFYGRATARLVLDGREVADVAIREGWGRSYDGRAGRASWCAQ